MYTVGLGTANPINFFFYVSMPRKYFTNSQQPMYNIFNLSNISLLPSTASRVNNSVVGNKLLSIYNVSADEVRTIIRV